MKKAITIREKINILLRWSGLQRWKWVSNELLIIKNPANKSIVYMNNINW